MFCPTCGGQLPNDAVFCGACGSKVSGHATAAPATVAQYSIANQAAQAATLPIDRLKAVGGAHRRSAKRSHRIIAGAVALVLVVGMVFFSMNACAQLRPVSYESAYEVANSLSDATKDFLTSDRTTADQANAIATAFAMMPEGAGEALVKTLGFKSADEAAEELNSYNNWDKLMNAAGCLDITFRPNSSESLSRDSLKSLQSELDDLGLDYYVEAAVPLTIKAKAIQSNRDFGLTRGDTPSTYGTAFYAIEVDGEWHLWVRYLESTYNSIHYLEEADL